MYEDEVREQEAPEVETPVETPEVSAEPKEKTVPLNKFLSEKQKRKELERRLAEMERRSAEDPAQKFVEKYKSLGFDEDAAKAIAEDFAHIIKQTAAKPKDTLGEEIEDLVEEHEFFDDAKSWEKEIREAIASGKASTPREAYLLIRDPDERAREIANRGSAPKTNKAMPVSKPAEPKSDALTAEEREELEEMKRVQPWAKWDADSYKRFARNR